jgi:hypothetical protein
MGGGMPLFTNYLEEEFSETHMQPVVYLCVRTGSKWGVPPDRHTTLPQDVVVLDGYAGPWTPLPRFYRGAGPGHSGFPLRGHVSYDTYSAGPEILGATLRPLSRPGAVSFQISTRSPRPPTCPQDPPGFPHNGRR